MKKGVFGFSVKDIAEIAIMCAIAIVLDKFVKIPFAPTGGSINLAMFPLYLVALRHGPFKGFLAGGIVFGLTDCLIDGYGMQTYPLEYLVAYGSVGVLGFVGKYYYNKFGKSNKGTIISILLVILAVVVATFIRVIGASIDSMVFYLEYLENKTFWGALAYNIPYITLSSAFVLILVCVFLPVNISITRIYKTSFIKAIDNLSTKEEQE